MQRISDYIGDYYRQNHSTPTTREISSAMGLAPATGYKYLVIELMSKQTAGANVNIYTSENLKGACYSSPQFGNAMEIVIDLDTCKYTSTTNKGKALNRKTVRMVTFKGTVSGKMFTVKNMFLSNDEKYNTTGITTLTDDVVEQRKGVFDLQGRRMARPTKPGFYIINGRKVIIK